MGFKVNVHADCQARFQQLSEGTKLLRYIIYKIDDKDVVVETVVSPNNIVVIGDDHAENSKTAYEHFADHLKRLISMDNNCRYAVFNFKFTYTGANISNANKIIFIQLCPDGASIEQKMRFKSAAEALKNALGTDKFLQVQNSDESEVSHAEVVNLLSIELMQKRIRKERRQIFLSIIGSITFSILMYAIVSYFNEPPKDLVISTV